MSLEGSRRKEEEEGGVDRDREKEKREAAAFFVITEEEGGEKWPPIRISRLSLAGGRCEEKEKFPQASLPPRQARGEREIETGNLGEKSQEVAPTSLVCAVWLNRGVYKLAAIASLPDRTDRRRCRW